MISNFTVFSTDKMLTTLTMMLNTARQGFMLASETGVSVSIYANHYKRIFVMVWHCM